MTDGRTPALMDAVCLSALVIKPDPAVHRLHYGSVSLIRSSRCTVREREHQSRASKWDVSLSWPERFLIDLIALLTLIRTDLRRLFASFRPLIRVFVRKIRVFYHIAIADNL